jgi:hypothetical protein
LVFCNLTLFASFLSKFDFSNEKCTHFYLLE